MQESPATRASLLVRLRDTSDGEAWQEFVHLYAPVIYGFARKRGLQDADAADLMQEVLRSVSSAVPRLEYDPIRGTLRATASKRCRWTGNARECPGRGHFASGASLQKESRVLQRWI